MWIPANMSAVNLTRQDFYVILSISKWFQLFLIERRNPDITGMEMTKRVRAPIGHIHISRIGGSTRWRLAICPTPGWMIAYKPLNDDTKILTETNTETFFPIPNFPKPKPILFFRYQIFRNRNRNHQKFGKSLETETKTETSQHFLHLLHSI